MKLEGKEKADVTAKALQMSLAYQFVTPLTSMIIRGMTDEDGLEPIVDKPPEGRGSAKGEAMGLRGLLRAKTSWVLILFLFSPFQILCPWVSLSIVLVFRRGPRGRGKQLVSRPQARIPLLRTRLPFPTSQLLPRAPWEPLYSLLRPGLRASLCCRVAGAGGTRGRPGSPGLLGLWARGTLGE